MNSYLSNRKQCTKICSNTSEFCTVTCGIPQGSLLGPLLFLIYVNDLPGASNFLTTLFADDTNLLMSDKKLHNLQCKVNMEVDKVNAWMRSNKLSLNYTKTCYMLLFKKPTDTLNFSITINGKIIKQTNYMKYLGVTLDHKLDWKQHILNLRTSLSRTCGIIYKLRHYVPLPVLKLLYNHSLFHSNCNVQLYELGKGEYHFASTHSSVAKQIHSSLFVLF